MHTNTPKPARAKGFTLLELIIVIAILAILSVAVILVINPAETLRRARDSQRLSDLAAVKSAIGLYLTDVTSVDLAAGPENCGSNVWVSEDSSQNITDPAMCGITVDPTQRALSAVGAPDGTGWVPVNLTAISSGSPLAAYPIDPVNAVVNGTSTLGAVTEQALMYTYVCNSTNNTFEVMANMESNQYSSGGAADQEQTDGGNNANLVETGTALTICGAY